jgi:hypothetical protein
MRRQFARPHGGSGPRGKGAPPGRGGLQYDLAETQTVHETSENIMKPLPYRIRHSLPQRTPDVHPIIVRDCVPLLPPNTCAANGNTRESTNIISERDEERRRTMFAGGVRRQVVLNFIHH